MKIKEILKKQNIMVIILIILMCMIILFFQTKKIGLHEDEGFTIASSVNPDDGVMYAYNENDPQTNEPPVWRSREYVTKYVTLAKENYTNLTSVYINQAKDNHPPIFYMLVHFSTILFGGNFSMYSVFVVNIIGFILSYFVIKKILNIMDKEHITIPALILYGLCMGTISMVIFQRMYMWLTLFILLYFYYNIKIYKNNFEMSKLDVVILGSITVCGFLIQYFFAVYALGIFLMMCIKMYKEKKAQNLKKYIIAHIVYAIIGIILFPPCIYHLFFTDRGIKNLGNNNYFVNFGKYISQLNYAFSIKTSTLILFIFLILLFLRIARMNEKENERFIVLLASVSTLIFFVITVKMTSFQELRYIMPVIPILVIILYIMLDTLIDIKYKEFIFTGISILLVLIGFILSSPRTLYQNYEEIIKIAEDNKDKSFVYVYDNYFNHMQSIPEMLTYKRTLIINSSRNDELSYVINDESLNNETSYILSIKNYMNNEEIIERIKSETEFKNVTKLYSTDCERADIEVKNNLYLVSK